MFSTLREIWSGKLAPVNVIDASYGDKVIFVLASAPDKAGKCVVVNDRGEYELRNADIRYWRLAP